jgi:cytochrome c
MKKYLLILTILLMVSCKNKEASKEPLYPETTSVQTPEQLGQELFEGKGNCYSCHKTNEKLIGPSIQEIAKIYKNKNGNLVSFLKGQEQPLVDPSQFEVMKANFAITQAMSEEELKALEAYFYSNLK